MTTNVTKKCTKSTKLIQAFSKRHFTWRSELIVFSIRCKNCTKVDHFCRPFFGRIIGARGATKQRIEGETKAQITIPRQGRNEDIVITGGSRENVASARQRIEMIVLSSRQKQPPTHFFGVRIQTDQIKENYERFKVKCVDRCLF